MNFACKLTAKCVSARKIAPKYIFNVQYVGSIWQQTWLNNITKKTLLSKRCYSYNGVQDGHRCFGSAINQSFFCLSVVILVSTPWFWGSSNPFIPVRLEPGEEITLKSIMVFKMAAVALYCNSLTFNRSVIFCCCRVIILVSTPCKV